MRKIAAHEIIWQKKHYQLSVAETEGNEVRCVYPLREEAAQIEWFDGTLDLDDPDWLKTNRLI